MISAMRSLFAGVFHAASVTRTGCSEALQRITSERAWLMSGGMGSKFCTAKGALAYSTPYLEEVILGRTEALMHWVPDLHPAPPEGGTVLPDI